MADKPEPPTVVPIYDSHCKQIGLTGKFKGNLSDLVLHAAGFRHKISVLSKQDGPSKLANSGKILMHQTAQPFLIDEPVIRSLIAESSNIFFNLQSKKPKSTEAFLQTSKTYRCAIRSCLNKLQEVLNESTDIEDVKKYENYVTIFYSIECVWHLCEFLLIDKHSSVCCVPNLLAWTKFHFSTPGQEAALMLMEMDVDMNNKFWPTVKGLVLQGQIDVARALLKLHSSSETIAFQLADKILQNMPVFSSYGGLSLQKYRSQWQYWAANVESKVQSGLLATESDLEEIMKLITGDNRAWNQVCKESTCWYEYFSGYLFFTQSTCKYFELGTFANDWLSQWFSSKGTGGGTGLRHLDRMVMSVMENNMTQLIHDIQNMFDNKWFLTHLADLLIHCDQLHITDQDNNKAAVITLRESLLFDFGTLLMTRSSMWEIGLDYLEFSSTEGIGAREMLLPRIPFQTEAQATKIISAARKCGLASVEAEICRVMVKRSLAQKRLGNALEWAIRSRDNIYVTNVANMFLEDYCKTGRMLCKDVLANVGAKMFISPRLLFLIKYFDFHQYYSERMFVPAAELLVNLLDSKIIPEFFWPTLLADAIPLLEYKDPIIPSKETYIILHHLENDLVPHVEKQAKLQKSKNAGNKDTNESMNLLNGSSQDLVQLLRLSCARNLSRSLIIENTLIM